MRPGGFVADPCCVVTGHDRQDRGSVDTDAVDLKQGQARWVPHEPLELTIERSDLVLVVCTRRASVGAVLVAWRTGWFHARGRRAAAQLPRVPVVGSNELDAQVVPVPVVREMTGAGLSRS